MNSSPSATESARFSLWPLPELKVVPGGLGGAPAVPRPRLTPEQAAYERGVVEGRAAAEQDAAASLRRAATMLTTIAHTLDATRVELPARLEQQLFELAIAVARQVIQREVRQDPEILRQLVRRALEAVVVQEPIEVRLHPEDARVLGEHVELTAPDGRRLDIRCVPDHTLTPGDCVIEMPHRIVDGRIETALAAIGEQLRDG